MRNGVIGSTADSDSVSRGSSPFSVAGNLPEGRFLIFPDRKCVMHTFYSHRSVAQLGRALRSGRRGRRFESCHSDPRKQRKTGRCRRFCNARFSRMGKVLRIFIKNLFKIIDSW